MRDYEPPEHLSPERKKLWRSIVSEFEVEPHHVESSLRGCCELLDRAAQAQRRLRRDGLFVTDRFGQLKPHPAIDVERKSRDSARLLLRELGLDHAAAEAAVRPPRITAVQ